MDKKMNSNKLYAELSPWNRYLIKMKELDGKTMSYLFLRFLTKLTKRKETEFTTSNHTYDNKKQKS